ncbi:glycosyltransferase [Paraburkholderia sp. LEh10]|uniref:glycosyltransferase n=1 Tax=Paraburkholderia sp. LEh10 TaxID=2821353 RepID=UPI001AE48565|nr:glycosyltransferase [Paraburkholderia sp. LEh10]MBP0593885.1 glycosyltransferase [Paraburkholderia sp. LEh10]
MMALPNNAEISCSGCGGRDFTLMAVRADGVSILQCAQCGLGMVQNIPENLAAFYGDNYYVNGGERGYADYRFAAEHGTGWASRLIKLLRDGGKILDIGCADGYLLANVGENFQRFGIEVNAEMARRATNAGVAIIGNDIFAPEIRSRYRGNFDVVSAIAVFEHLSDFRAGFEVAIDIMKDDGILLFEVPVMSQQGNNEAWLNSSFEHIYYPTEASIRHIVEERLNCYLVGAELVIKDYASTYVGAVTRSEEGAKKFESVFTRLLNTDDASISKDETIARLHLRLLHMAQSSEASISDINALESSHLTKPVMARLVQLWTFDLQRLKARNKELKDLTQERDALQELAKKWEQSWRQKSEQLATETGRLSSLLEVARRDAKLNAAQATHAIVVEMERSAAFEAKAAEASARAATADARVADAQNRYIAAERELQAIRASNLWRVMQPLRRVGARYPHVSRRLRQAAKLTLWSMQFKLGANLREVRRRRAEAMAFAEAELRRTQDASLLAEARLLPVAGVVTATEYGLDKDVWPDDRPLVSIIVPCFNYGHLVADAIESAMAQTFQDFEVIVVEGGSNSTESRKNFAALIERAPSRVRVLLQDKPYRAGANRNYGISHARGKYVCCLDADDRLDPTYLEKAVFLLEYYGYDVVGPSLKFFGNRNEVWAPHERPDLDMLVKGNHVLTCSLFRRELWREAGGYRDSDPTAGHIHEDWLFWVRLAALGARFMNVREPLFFYRSHGNTLSNSDSVLSNDVQAEKICEFNADLLTPEAFKLARRRAAMEIRAPRPLRNLVRPEHEAPNRSTRTLMLAVPYLILGGAERLLSALVEHLAANGWRIVIVSTVHSDDSNGDTTEWFQRTTSEVFHLPRFLSPDRWRDFLDYLFASRDISVLWVVGSAFVYDCLPALKHAHKQLKVVDLLFNTVGHVGNNRRYADYIDLNLVENTEVQQWLIDAGESPDRIRLIQSGVDLDVNAPGAKNSALLAQHGIAPGTLIVGFSGRWSDEKDPLGFVEIARRIPPTVRVSFVITGAGPLDGALRAAVQQASFPPGKFTICGSVPELAPYLRLYDLLLLPSRIDGRPNVVMEALANGTPVIASRVGALPDLLEEGQQGYLCEPGDYDEFARRIVELANDPAKLASFKDSARKFAERRFNRQAMLNEYAESFERLVESS